jgi:uncharacterized protein YdeI (YjbR/CyaY-like superfamily)
MGKRDPRVDAYIRKAAPFAQPILVDIREMVHAACPGVEEALKWKFPHFLYKGMLCGMAAFKQHAAFGFWKGSLVTGTGKGTDAMGQFGRITKRSDLPANKVLAAYVKKAVMLNDQGVKTPRTRKAAAPKAIRIPADLASALKKSATAQATFRALSPSHKREYLEWIAEAKTEATRQRRRDLTIEWLTEGKSRHWKYQRPAAPPAPRPS